MRTAAWPSALCLLALLQPATQVEVHLSVLPVLQAEGGTGDLKCEVSSPHQGLSVKHMEWFRKGASLCFVKGNLSVNYAQSQKRFECKYSHRTLSLILHNVRPEDGGNYTCKMRSNMGTKSATTTVKVKEREIILQPRSDGKASELPLGAGAGSVRAMGTLSWCISLLLVVILK